MLTRPAPRAPVSAAALPPPGVGCPAASWSENSHTGSEVTPSKAMDPALYERRLTAAGGWREAAPNAGAHHSAGRRGARGVRARGAGARRAWALLRHRCELR